MAFKDTYRLEKVYYENMWTLLRSLKALKENPSADEITKVNEILDDTIACNESIIIIYKNLGELYAEVAQKFVDLLTDLKAIRDDLEMWKNEINEKIDDNHNYLMGLIRDLDERVTSLEGRMDTAEGDIDALEGRMDTAEDDIDGLQDDVSDLQQNKQDKLTAGFGIGIDSNNEISVDTADVQEKLIAGQNITLTPDTTDPTKTVIDAEGGGSDFPAYTTETTIVSATNIDLPLSPIPSVCSSKRTKSVSHTFTSTEKENKFYGVRIGGGDISGISASNVDVSEYAHYDITIIATITFKNANYAQKTITSYGKMNYLYAYGDGSNFNRVGDAFVFLIDPSGFRKNGYEIDNVSIQFKTQEMYNMPVTHITALFAQQTYQRLNYTIFAYN